jgi:hypothetical protein
VLPEEREDLQAVIAEVTGVQLVPTHSQLFCIAEQPSLKAMAKLQRLRIQGDDLIPVVLVFRLPRMTRKSKG